MRVEFISTSASPKRGAIAAQRIGVFAHYVDRMFRRRMSVEHGTFGAPTFFVGEEMYFGKDRLRDVEEAIMENRK